MASSGLKRDLGSLATEMDTEPARPEVQSAPGAQSHVGTLLADRYRVDKLLGEGGMGQVYRAEHVHMRKAVALKVLHRELTAQPEIVARFEREAVAAARIEHPHVAAATDFGRLADGSFYLVLEFVEGKSLTKLVAEAGRLAAPRALWIARQISDALSTAHQAGIVHRDLKPDNVMLVARDDNEDFVKVLDFGIAKVQSEDTGDQPVLTKVGTVFGTPEYMAPEQARGIAADARADLYTLGMILYEMLSGKTAFADSELLVVLTRQMTKEPPPLPSDIDAETQALVMTLLSKEPDERVQTAADLCDRIDALLARQRSNVVASRAYPVVQGSAPTDEPVLARFREQAEALAGSLGRALEARAPSVKALMLKPLRVGQHSIPTWIPLVSLLAGCLLVGAFAATGNASEGNASRAGEATQAAESESDDPDDQDQLNALIEAARGGDRAVLSELRILAGKDPRAWLALGTGYARIQQFDASLGAYGTALELDAALASDARLLMDVRAAADAPGQREAALKLAETLGSTGADLVYDLWWSLRANAAGKDSAAEVLAVLQRAPLRDKASPALDVALTLNDAKSCVGYKKIMDQAAEHADQRALPKLQPLTQRSGCGFLGLRDCYACLRGGSQLSTAIDRARSEPGPSFSSLPASAAPAAVPGKARSEKARAGKAPPRRRGPQSQ